MPSIDDIVTFDDDDPPPGQSAFVVQQPTDPIVIADYDEEWPHWFSDLAHLIRQALGLRAIRIEHVGSTAVPGLAAKPVIDIDLTVADPADEPAWLPQLESAGFALNVREPWWHEHRCLRSESPRANVHVFPPSSPELVKHVIFRDWLRVNAADRERYATVKLSAAAAASASSETVMEYNARKTAVIRDIYARAFTAAGLRAPDNPE